MAIYRMDLLTSLLDALPNAPGCSQRADSMVSQALSMPLSSCSHSPTPHLLLRRNSKAITLDSWIPSGLRTQPYRCLKLSPSN